jgi:hypothetical protein
MAWPGSVGRDGSNGPNFLCFRKQREPSPSAEREHLPKSEWTASDGVAETTGSAPHPPINNTHTHAFTQTPAARWRCLPRSGTASLERHDLQQHDLETGQDSRRPVTRYVGRGSIDTEKLREELEAQNDGMKIPAAVRWLGRASDVKARFSE